MCFFWCFRSCYMEHACGICALTFPKKIKRAWLEDYDEKARVVRWKLPIVHVKLRISIERMWQDARDIFAQVREATSEFEDVWMNITMYISNLDNMSLLCKCEFMALLAVLFHIAQNAFLIFLSFSYHVKTICLYCGVTRFFLQLGN
ncbi:unnamed protein product [Cylicocyclus nassatus]|uniref:Uncharacterized protein n=1 Tax=Cylicocyclus nassatus TaxID=53992 RepID=A0AA36H7F3_CYLNA|nr:unnamed protein product [Cylicocyclus nassatus]